MTKSDLKKTFDFNDCRDRLITQGFLQKSSRLFEGIFYGQGGYRIPISSEELEKTLEEVDKAMILPRKWLKKIFVKTMYPLCLAFSDLIIVTHTRLEG